MLILLCLFITFHLCVSIIFWYCLTCIWREPRSPVYGLVALKPPPSIPLLLCFHLCACISFVLGGGGGGGCSCGWVPFTPPYPHLLNIDFLVIHWSSCITCFNCILVKFTNFWYQKYFSLISGGCNRDLLYPVCYLKCIITIVAAVALCPIGHHLEPAGLQQAGLMAGSTLLGAWASGLQISP